MARRLTLQFLRTDAAAGVALVVAVALALAVANSPVDPVYRALLAHPVIARLGPIGATLPLSAWVARALMTLVFFGVGLELKLEIVKGELSSARRLALPALGALGGAAVGGLTYACAQALSGHAIDRGCAIPAASDVVLGLAALALTHRGTRARLRPFLVAVIVAANALSVAIIALLFTRAIDAEALAGAAAALCALALLGRWRGAPKALFVVGAIALWGLTARSGVDPSVAGVAAAATLPMRARRLGERGDVERTAQALRPWTTWGVLPLFVFCTAGVAVSAAAPGAASAWTVLGVGLALTLGKTAGMMGAWAAAVRLGWGRRPAGAAWSDLLGLALICGGGFGVSLYVAALAFSDPLAVATAAAKLGVVIGSLAAVGSGVLVLRRGSAARLEAQRR